MKKITRKEALIECKKMWEWLAENVKPDMAKGRNTIKFAVFKYNWPGLIEYIDTYDVPFNNCPCCHYAYVKGQADVNCKRCPLKSLWGSLDYACTTFNSAYSNWRSTGEPRYARMIVNACNDELAKYEAKRKGN